MRRKSSYENKQKQTEIVVTKEILMRTVNIIKQKGVKTCPMDSTFSRIRKLRIISMCSSDTTIPNRRRPNSEVLPTNVQLLLSQLKKCVSEHNWAAVARCVHYMLDLNGKLLPFIWKSAVLVMLNHPNVTAQTLNEFLQMCLGLRTHLEKAKFLKQLLTLKDLAVYSKKDMNITRISEEEDNIFD